MSNAFEPRLLDVIAPLENFKGFGNRLPTFKVVKIAKVKGFFIFIFGLSNSWSTTQNMLMILHWIECAFNSMYSIQCLINLQFCVLGQMHVGCCFCYQSFIQ